MTGYDAVGARQGGAGRGWLGGLVLGGPVLGGLMLAGALLVGCGGDDPESAGAHDPVPGTVLESQAQTASSRAPTLGTAPTTTSGPRANPAPVSRPPLDQIDPSRLALTLEDVVELSEPIALAARSGDEALYVAQRDGLVVRVGASGAVTSVADLRTMVAQGNEQGLAGLTFSADGMALYLSYTDLEGSSALDQWAMVGEVADESTRRQLLRVEQASKPCWRFWLPSMPSTIGARIGRSLTTAERSRPLWLATASCLLPNTWPMILDPSPVLSGFPAADLDMRSGSGIWFGGPSWGRLAACDEYRRQSLPWWATGQRRW